jgi:hypothetical protein
MECSVLDRGRVCEVPGPGDTSEYFPAPGLDARVSIGQLRERERLPDAPAQLVRYRIHLVQEAAVEPGVTGQRLKAPVTLLPLLAGMLEDRSHGRAY